jgi:2-polyprenyl-3-methyl-5-hydroxy-6-metoxy-1,4-benzoquinol methylase
VSYATGTSNLAQWEWILWAIESSPYPHQRILDVGAGYGKAAALLREKLNVKPCEVGALEPDVDAGVYRWMRSAYSLIAPETAQEFTEWDRWDTVLMADVIEHIPAPDGLALLDRIPGQVIISTPLDADVAAHAADPSIPDLERHVTQWNPADFQGTGRLDTYFIRNRQLIVRLKPKGA